MKSSALGLAGLAACKITTTDSQAAAKEWPEDNSELQINPEVDNLRVAMVRDPDMILNDVPSSWDFSDVNDNMDRDIVHANMDAMARYLTQQNDNDTAWDTLFMKPPDKTWQELRVAMKVNCIETQVQTKITMIEKICLELNRDKGQDPGVPFANMIIFDGRHNASGNSKYSPYEGGNGLPDGVRISNGNGLLGDMESTDVPRPWDGTAECTGDLANGSIDILVNFAVNKGHTDSRGRCTLSMKNHFGTFDPSPGHDGNNDEQFNYLISINKSGAILGGDVPRQQLVVMDAIYSMTGGPMGEPDNLNYAMIMGTFGPAVDYATVKLIREEEMGASHTDYAEEFLTAFGYSESDRDNFIAMSPDENEGRGVGLVTRDYTVSSPQPPAKKNVLFLHLIAGKYRSKAIKIPFSSSDKILSASIYNARGNLVRKLMPKSQLSGRLLWDGRNRKGGFVRSGTYVVKVRGKSQSGTGKIVLN
ncbi:DUF362 domain-containing protein [Fibrobacterota bacterium]